jgi:hypothetical protein
MPNMENVTVAGLVVEVATAGVETGRLRQRRRRQRAREQERDHGRAHRLHCAR